MSSTMGAAALRVGGSGAASFVDADEAGAPSMRRRASAAEMAGCGAVDAGVGVRRVAVGSAAFAEEAAVPTRAAHRRWLFGRAGRGGWGTSVALGGSMGGAAWIGSVGCRDAAAGAGGRSRRRLWCRRFRRLGWLGHSRGLRRWRRGGGCEGARAVAMTAVGCRLGDFGGFGAGAGGVISARTSCRRSASSSDFRRSRSARIRSISASRLAMAGCSAAGGAGVAAGVPVAMAAGGLSAAAETSTGLVAGLSASAALTGVASSSLLGRSLWSRCSAETPMSRIAPTTLFRTGEVDRCRRRRDLSRSLLLKLGHPP